MVSKRCLDMDHDTVSMASRLGYLEIITRDAIRGILNGAVRYLQTQRYVFNETA